MPLHGCSSCQQTLARPGVDRPIARQRHDGMQNVESLLVTAVHPLYIRFAEDPAERRIEMLFFEGDVRTGKLIYAVCARGRTSRVAGAQPLRKLVQTSPQHSMVFTEGLEQGGVISRHVFIPLVESMLGAAIGAIRKDVQAVRVSRQ